MRRLLQTLGTLVLVAGCGGAQEPAADPAQPALPAAAPPTARTEAEDEYVTLPPEQREAPPPQTPAPPWSFPDVKEGRLASGLGVRVVERHTLPIVGIKLVVLSGQATDGDKQGLAVLSGEMLKVGGSGAYTSRQLLNRVESMGSNLEIITSRDATSIAMDVTSDRFEEAMDLLGVVVQKPQFNAQEFNKLKRREMDRVSSNAKSEPGWAASMVMYQALFGDPDPKHPYAAFDATYEQVEQRQLWEVKTWIRTHFTPENSFLLVVGDVTLDQARTVSEKHLLGWKGKAPTPLTFTSPKPREKLEILLVDRPKSSQAEVRLAALGPERRSDDWVPMRVATQILGGGAAGRLFLDVRERQSLAYSAYALLDEVAHGPTPIVLKAGTQTAKAGLTLKALLDHAARMAAAPPSPQETTVATQFLSDVFLVNVESVGDVATLATRLGVFGLDHDYYDRYREAVRKAQSADAQTAFARYIQEGRGIVVVAGDAERLSVPLSHFGDVQVIDADRGFKRTATVPHDPNAPIELERIDGT